MITGGFADSARKTWNAKIPVVTIAHSTSMRLASTKRRQRIADFSTVFMLNLTRQLQNRHAAFKSSNIRIRSCSEAEVKSGAGGGESRRRELAAGCGRGEMGRRGYDTT